MFDYIGEECIVCKQKFKKGDDIVVCPDCGTPYHRECFKKSGACINLSLHENHQSWSDVIKKQNNKSNEENAEQDLYGNSSSQNEEPQQNDHVKCPYCGCMNNKGSSFCSGCGKSLSGQRDNSSFYQYANSSTYVNIGGKEVKVDFGDRYAGMNPDDSFEGAKLGNVAEFIGATSYMMLVVFKKFSAKVTKISTNLVCLFFPYLYFAYRKMWKMCFAFIAVISLLSVPSFLDSIVTLDLTQYKQLLDTSMQQSGDYTNIVIQIMQKWQVMLQPHSALINNLDVICQALIMALRILAFLFANYLYYRFTVKKVIKIQNETPPTYVADECRNSGGTSIANVFIGIIVKVAAEFIFFSIAAVVLLMFTK